MRCGQHGIKGMLMESIDKDSPLKSKWVGNNKCPWITITSYGMKCVNEISLEAVMDCDRLTWDLYRLARNQTDNEIKKAKRKHFTEN